jgi:DNA-binding response OmpR family regulator
VGKLSEKKAVLVIDDDKAIGAVLADLLQSEGFEVICCDSGLAALGLAKGKCFNVIITDYRMPGMDGLETTRALRLQCPDALIIGFSSEHKRNEFLDAGADAFFKKPFSFKEIISLIDGNIRYSVFL